MCSLCMQICFFFASLITTLEIVMPCVTVTRLADIADSRNALLVSALKEGRADVVANIRLTHTMLRS